MDRINRFLTAHNELSSRIIGRDNGAAGVVWEGRHQ